jgi:3'-phosphoadenosine 5'-phosphosulfate sulfotransferase (PAPS reductase)/FAD synthetase
MAIPNLSREILALWEAHVAEAQKRADAQLEKDAAAGKRKPRRSLTRAPVEHEEDTAVLLPFEAYDTIIVSFSGGKDSLACFLHLLDLGVPKEKIELWHQSVDGAPGHHKRFFDWPITEDYCRAVADAFDVPLYFQWLEGGFEGELLKTKAATRKSAFQLPDGRVEHAGGGGKITTRREFPKPGEIKFGRWCSSYLKIDVAKKALTNDPRFTGTKTLILTGERREESLNRSRYAEVKRYGYSPPPNATPEEKRAAAKRSRETPFQGKRDITEWKPIIDWNEPHVWDILRRHKVRPHPAYYIGFSRVSCMPCIFGNAAQWATVNTLDPALMKKIAKYEHEFYKSPEKPGTIHAKRNVLESAAQGLSYLEEEMPEDEFEYAVANAKLAMSEHYPRELVRVGRWDLPRGANRGSGGPT